MYNQSNKPTHGEKVKLDDNFQVGGEELFLPNGPNVPLAETANCRCVVKYVRKGALLWKECSNLVLMRRLLVRMI